VPVPWGWSTVGSLKVGDTVFDEQGYPVFVQEAGLPVRAKVWRVGLTNKRYESGAVLMTSDHELITWNRDKLKDSGLPNVPTDWAEYDGERHTLEAVSETLEEYDGSNRKLMHVIPITLPLVLPNGDGWTVPPYVMGLALQIHDRRSGLMTCKESMWDWYESQFRAEGYPVTRIGKPRLKRWRPNDDVVFSSAALNRDLGRIAEYNIGEGRIPVKYLRGSAGQRLALLEGLLDVPFSDIERHGDNRALENGKSAVMVWCGRDGFRAEQVGELVRSLGYTASIRLNPKSNCNIVRYTPVVNPYRNPRLRAGLADLTLLARNRFIRFCWRVQSVAPETETEVRALKVTSPSGLMTVSDLFLPVCA
jgi:hypothetical protein